MKYNIALPPKEIFVNQAPTATDSIVNEGSVTFVMTGMEVDKNKGVLLHLEGADFPKKGFPFPEATYAINLCKRFLREFIHLGIKHWYLLPFINTKAVIDSYCTIAARTCSPYLLNEDHMMPVARELQRMINKLELNPSLGRIIGAIIQYDDAYFHRVEDILSETTKEQLVRSPILEIGRLKQVLFDREKNKDQAKKLTRVMTLLQLALIIPKYRKIFKKIVKECNFSNLQYDEADKYWVMNRTDYRYMGLTEDQRISRTSGKPIGLKIST